MWLIPFYARVINSLHTWLLQELLSVYQNSAGDKWRAMSTTKVIQAIKKYPKEITTYEACSDWNTPTLYIQ